MKKKIAIHNPNNLPLLAVDDMVEFQGDLKDPPTEDELNKLKKSIIENCVFVPKFILSTMYRH